MDENRNPGQPKKPDNNEIWSWVVIAILFAFAWPVGLIVLFAKLSDSSKRKKDRGAARQTIIESDAAREANSAASQTQKRRTTRSNITRTPELSNRGAKIMRTVGIALAVIGAIALVNTAGNYLFFLQEGHWAWFLEEIFYPLGITAGGAGLLLGSH